MTVKKKEYTAKQKALLAEIEAGTAQQGYCMVTDNKDLRVLFDDNGGPIEINMNGKEGNKIPARMKNAKPNGVDHTVNISTEAPAPPAPAPPVPEPKSATGLKFDLDGVGMNLPTFFPEPQRTVRKPEYYPFSKLENVGDSFLVAATEQYPEPWKTLRSAVNAANKRFSTDTGQEEKVNGKTKKIYKVDRKFEVRKVMQGDTYNNGFVEKATGARIYRSI